MLVHATLHIGMVASSVTASMFEINVQFAETILCNAQRQVSLCLVISEG